MAQEMPELIGGSQQIRELREEIRRIAPSDAKVLITGESGVGKELVAHAIHRHSPRARHLFVAMNCAGVAETLLESELFGHARGSFTGAFRDKTGKLELAHSGTVFLDEVGEMTPRMQGLLLRFLETGELQKVGASRAVSRVDVRVVAATNRDLPALIAENRFREDLYYRLNVIHLEVPPLRDRPDDIPVLVQAFLDRAARHALFAPRDVSPDAMAALVEYSWPGNVRQLENVVEQILVKARSPVVGFDDLPLEIRAPRGTGRARGERRRTVADDLVRRMREERESFWSAVYTPYMQREITREHVREVVRRGLEEARGNYRIVAALFNLAPGDYKRFLNFLRKHDCRLPFKEYRR